jgi:hypothetical protein
MPDINDPSHDEARAKVGQRVVTLKMGRGRRPAIWIGYVVGAKLPVIYNGEGHDEPAEPSFGIEWNGGPQVEWLP